MNTNEKKAAVALLVSDKGDFQTSSNTKGKYISNDKRVNPVGRYENFF